MCDKVDVVVVVLEVCVLVREGGEGAPLESSGGPVGLFSLLLRVFLGSWKLTRIALDKIYLPFIPWRAR